MTHDRPTTKQIEALKLALERLETAQCNDPEWQDGYYEEAITAIREALAEEYSGTEQPAQQQAPVACPYCKNAATLGAVYYDQNCAGCVKRMTAPASKPWVGLTDEEIEQAFYDFDVARTYIISFARAIEAKLKDKNGY